MQRALARVNTLSAGGGRVCHTLGGAWQVGPRHMRQQRTVPSPPAIVPVHWKMLSPSGKAESDVSPLIMRDMSSDCSLRERFGRALG